MRETPANDDGIKTLLTTEAITRIKALSPELKKQLDTANMLGDMPFVLKILGITKLTSSPKLPKLIKSAASVHPLRPSDSHNPQLEGKLNVRDYHQITSVIVAETRALTLFIQRSNAAL